MGKFKTLVFEGPKAASARVSILYHQWLYDRLRLTAKTKRLLHNEEKQPNLKEIPLPVSYENLKKLRFEEFAALKCLEKIQEDEKILRKFKENAKS